MVKDFCEHETRPRQPQKNQVRRWVGGAAALVCLLMAAATALALIETDEWWIRVLDFPACRLQRSWPLPWSSTGLTRPARDGEPGLFPWLSGRGSGLASVMILPYTALWPQQWWRRKPAPGEPRALSHGECPEGQPELRRPSGDVVRNRSRIISSTEIDQWWARRVWPGWKTRYPHYNPGAPIQYLRHGPLFFSRFPLERAARSATFWMREFPFILSADRSPERCRIFFCWGCPPFATAGETTPTSVMPNFSS